MSSATAYVFPMVCRCGETVATSGDWERHLIRAVRANDHGRMFIAGNEPGVNVADRRPPAWSPADLKAPPDGPDPLHQWESYVADPEAAFGSALDYRRLNVPGGWIYVLGGGERPVFVPFPPVPSR